MADRNPRASMADALHHRPGGSPVVDLIAPAPDAPPDLPDALSALLDPPPAPGHLGEYERGLVIRLARLQADKRRYKAMYEGLGPDIERLQARLIELAAERQLYSAKGRIALPAVTDEHGVELVTTDIRQIWPAYREDPDTEEPYQAEHVIAALRACGLDELIEERTEQFGWPRYVRERVKAWRARCGEAGVTDEAGRYVDADGVVLSDEERDDPLADILALPGPLRAVVEPVEQLRLQVGERRGSRRAVPAVDAAVDAADGAAGDAADRAGAPR